MEFESFAQAVREVNLVSYGTAHRRVKERGWTPEEAISTPPFSRPENKFLSGMKYPGTRLTLVKRLDNKPGQKDVKWLCLCSCGTYTEVAKKNLIAKRTRSCGCLKKERGKDGSRDQCGRVDAG